MRGNHRTQCRIFKRCLLFFAAISLLPFALIYLISTDQFYRIKSYDVSIKFILFLCSNNIIMTIINVCIDTTSAVNTVRSSINEFVMLSIWNFTKCWQIKPRDEQIVRANKKLIGNVNLKHQFVLFYVLCFIEKSLLL